MYYAFFIQNWRGGGVLIKNNEKLFVRNYIHPKMLDYGFWFWRESKGPREEDEGVG